MMILLGASAPPVWFWFRPEDLWSCPGSQPTSFILFDVFSFFFVSAHLHFGLKIFCLSLIVIQPKSLKSIKAAVSRRLVMDLTQSGNMTLLYKQQHQTPKQLI